MRGFIPEQIIELLEENALVLWCSTCAKTIYTTVTRNSITERVSRQAIAGHEDAFLATKHTVTAWAKDVKESKPN